jgi:nucleoside-diphosphate-sugar epimerase
MAKVYVSGATGFVGKNLLRYLKGRALNSEKLNLREPMLSSVFDDAEGGTIVHLAGKAHDLKKKAVTDEYFDVNFELTKQLFDLFLASDASKFVFVSSVKAVADKVDGSLSEDHIPAPVTDYGKSKLMAEEYILEQSLPPRKALYILRPCMIHGPGNKGNLNLLYKLISKGIPYPLAAFENKRSFLSVENLCFVIQELLERDDIPSGIYNVADDEALSTNHLIQLIANASDRSPKLWKINPRLIRSLAKLGDLLKLPLTTERLNKLTENYIVDNTKIRHAMGKELPVHAKDGIIKTIKSFQ